MKRQGAKAQKRQAFAGSWSRVGTRKKPPSGMVGFWFGGSFLLENLTVRIPESSLTLRAVSQSPVTSYKLPVTSRCRVRVGPRKEFPETSAAF